MENHAILHTEVLSLLRQASIEVVNANASGGREVCCRCPRHEDRDGHLYFNKDTGAGYCHKCHWRTHVRSLGLPGTDEPSGSPSRRSDVLEAATAFYERQMTAEAVQYLTNQRGLPAELLTRFRVGWAAGGLGQHLLNGQGLVLSDCTDAGVVLNGGGGVRDRFVNRIVFPHVVNGRVFNITARAVGDSEPKYMHLPGEIEYPYNWSRLSEEGVVLVEGTVDVLSLEAWGIPSVALLGSGNMKEHWAEACRQLDRVYVCCDGDDAGRRGALEICRAIGPNARLVRLPDGRDPNDFYRTSSREEFLSLLDKAEDAVSHRIHQLPPDMSKVDLVSRLRPILGEIAAEDPPLAEAHLDVLGEQFSLNDGEKRAYRRQVAELRRASATTHAHRAATDVEPTHSATFPGLIDIVEHDGEPAFYVLDDQGYHVKPSVQQDGKVLIPPPGDQMRWLLPRSDRVEKHLTHDTDEQLYDDLVEYHISISELPTDGHYELLAAWDMHTYLLEQFQYSPYIWLYAVPERGKTRTGKAIAYVAYRAIHVESLRDAYLVRFANNFGGTVFFDVMGLWRKAERERTEDILLHRYERGATVPRVLYPDRGPHKDTVHYSIFGPTIIGTNEPIHPILESRAVVINMPEATRQFEADVTPDRALHLKERLVAFRARHIDEPMPEISKPARGRFGDIMKPIVQVVEFVRRDRREAVVDLIRSLEQDRLVEKADSLESQILQVVYGLKDQVDRGLLPVKVITEGVNEGRPDNRRISPNRVGHRLKALGFRKGKTGGGAVIVWDDAHLSRTMVAYGLQQTSQSSQSPQSSQIELETDHEE